MRVLFVHQNFPGQYLHLAPELAARGHEVRALTVETNKQKEIVPTARYPFAPDKVAAGHPLASTYNGHVARGEAVARASIALRAQGFVPDVILGHLGWGETLFLKDVWPDARVQVYAEFFYTSSGADVGFDPEFGAAEDTARIRTTARQASLLLAMHAADRGLAPTMWQASRFPPAIAERIDVIHDGVDTARVAPAKQAYVSLGRGGGLTLRPGDEVVTFINRNLEPYRGYHSFMRALPRILAERPKARAIIVGGDGVSYGAAAPEGRTWKNVFLTEVQDRLDLERVHFVGRVPYEVFVNLMRVTRAHVYLTYPFVLSWSLLEAMSAGALVVASRTPPVEEVVRHGENGLLTDFFDADALAATVVEALTAPSRFQHLRAAARRTIVEGYDLRSRCLPRHVALVEALGRGELPAAPVRPETLLPRGHIAA